MANRFAKKTIDFDVYERQDKESQINWGKVGADITKAFSDVATDRQAKKDAIQKSFTDQQAAAADMGEYNDVTIQQYAINGGQKIANYNQDMYNLVQKGIVKPSEYTKFTNNVTANLKLVKANAKAYDEAFKLYTDRTQTNQNAALERYQAGMLEGFASLNNLELDWDPMTGEAVNIRVDDEGNPIPGESMTVQNMSVMLKQQYNAYDLDGSIKTVKDRLGSVITADLKASLGNSVVITEEMVTKAEQDFFDPKNKRGQDVLRKEALAVLTDDVGKQDLLAENSAILTEKKEKYRVGSLEEYEQWNEENPGDEKNNPILRTKFEGGRLVPEFNEFQDEAATNYMMGMISNSLDVKQTKESKNLPSPTGPQIALGEKNKELLSKGKNLMYAVSGDPDESAAGLRYIVDASNGAITDMEATDTGFIVTYPGRDPLEINTQTERDATQEDIDTWVSENPDKTAADAPFKVGDKINEDANPEESMRKMWKAAGLSDAEFDAWLDAGGRELLEGRKTTRNIQRVSGPKKSIEYDPQAKLTYVKDGVEVEGSGVDVITNSVLGNSPSVAEFNTNAQFIREYTKLLKRPKFFPKGIGEGVITFDTDADPDEMIFTIDGTEYNIGDVFGQNTTETVGLVEEAIKKEVAKGSGGGGGMAKHNKKK